MSIKSMTSISILASGVLLSGPSASADTPYRILLTNDDGIYAAGLQSMVEALHPLYEIVVAAPAKKHGGSSHATALWEGPMKIEALTVAGNVKAYAVHGLPADAARFGIVNQNALAAPVDLVISGINHGENLGSLSHLSGTVGAAMEATYYGLPAIAVSLDSATANANDFGAALTSVKYLIEKVRAEGLPDGVVLNVNVPAAASGLRVAAMGRDNIKVEGYTRDGESYTPVFSYPEPAREDTDLAAYARGFTVVTPLQIDWTATGALEAMTDWLGD
ncbi:5'/3'-nucleotidase SurE [Parahaliea mediterranea]|uniref:5'-nucleotidase SurE n=1 Tax=Parahaliea mediterranea TaxID=651086 RepID=A0A939DGP7_9GAMM|nr:5'/3'-nucleotidase SurE [Parahaliea mediterranea]MBN7797197.1 5'/3'-nucleotidase SurE [Parahaliea mediterranea]